MHTSGRSRRWLLGGGSKSQAHRLWDYYSHRRPYPDGVYWLVFSDHVFTPDLGAEGGGAFGREAIPCQAP